MSAKLRHSLFRAKVSQSLLSQAKGFTLIELLVVIVIVGVLSAVAIPQFLNQIRRSRVAEAQAALTDVSRGSEAYRLDWTNYPSEYAAIGRGCSSDWCGPAKDKYQNDPWSAPNYGAPALLTDTPAQRGLIIAVLGNTDVNPAYVNVGGFPLLCELGLGKGEKAVSTGDYFVGKSCNVFDDQDSGVTITSGGLTLDPYGTGDVNYDLTDATGTTAF
ncbi:type IV pilin protein [Thermostichus vulcanus]|uniref:Prepilin-type N-terminal cleavage/methylation domain-containing protein n=1 Tax=Thermostichus vulcanus str. 'Rupite' TaxID=2813851 RepID=A0ABT0C728_THEVL|nr:prepilin-type N-terminal cleavage/methylation domain-containing protein [Thermostichus vulcanus]MCJ2541598.1 prepilin-type N-terminal cleavage/methylation domain-containing protein [Thermostichus vulcanus str. 'Rupite']